MEGIFGAAVGWSGLEYE